MISMREMSTDSGGRVLGSPDTETKRCRPRSGSSERGYHIVTLIKVPETGPDRNGLSKKPAKRCPWAESGSLKILRKPISISCVNA